MEHDTGTRSAGRTFTKSVYGDTDSAIELAALDAARAFFGPQPLLEVVRDYMVTALPHNDPHREDGAYHARVTVRVSSDPS